MNRNNIFLIFLISILLIPIARGQDTQSIENTSKAKIQERQVKINDVPLSTREAFVDTLLVNRKPGGIILVQNNCVADEPKPQTEQEIASLNESLDLIVKLDSQYSWSIEDGVVNLIPTNNEPDFFKIQINEFRLDGDVVITMALEKLLQLPEVKSKAMEINLNKGLRFLGLSPPPNSKSRLKFELRNVTLRQALNEIARKSGCAVWRYRESNCNGKISSSLEFIAY